MIVKPSSAAVPAHPAVPARPTGIAYTAMLTAFYVDNGPHLPLWGRLPVLAFWLLPAVIAAPIITRAIIRAKNKARLSGPETSPAAESS
jgi:hypothetical protein